MPLLTPLTALLSPTNNQSPTPPPTPLIILTYNIHSCVSTNTTNSTKSLAQTINSITHNDSPVSIACLQEIEVNTHLQKTRFWSIPHDDDQPESLGKSTNLPYVRFASTIKSVKIGKGIKEFHDLPECYGSFGNAILSRFPILDTKLMKYKRYFGKTLRGCMACLIDISGCKKIWCVNTHLGCHTGGEQAAQATELVSFIRNILGVEDIPLCLCLDANSLRYFNSIKTISKLLTDTDCLNVAGSGGGGGGVWLNRATFPSVGIPGCINDSCLLKFCKPIWKLDYIFVTDSLSRDCDIEKEEESGDGRRNDTGAGRLDVVSTYVANNVNTPGAVLNASDHCCLVAVFNLK